LTGSLIAIISLGLAFLVLSPDSSKTEPVVQVANQSTETIESTTPIQDRLDDLTIEQKIGQMLFVGYDGSDTDEQLKNMVNSNYLGGVMLMGPNVSDTNNASLLIDDLQSISKNESSTSLFIGIDQEGGIVQRITDPTFELTSQPQINTIEQAEEIAAKRAIELTRLGINTNFSPVVETITDPNSFLYDRVFRGSSQDVRNYTVAYVNSYEQNGLMSTIKHFPGHNNASIDSHIGLPSSNMTDQEFEQHISTFSQTIGDAKPTFTMVGHILVPTQDPNLPSSLSPTIINDYLKTDIGYEGLVITDDMSMGAIIKNYGKIEAAVRAIEAGNDILLYVEDQFSISEIHTALVSKVDSGELKEELIDQSVLKILTVKYQQNLLD